MATLETQYKNFKIQNPNSTFTFEEWQQWFSSKLGEEIKRLKCEGYPTQKAFIEEMSIFYAENIDEYSIGQEVEDFRGVSSRIINKTRNSIEVFRKRESVDGIDCTQWFFMKDFTKVVVGKMSWTWWEKKDYDEREKNKKSKRT